MLYPGIHFRVSLTTNAKSRTLLRWTGVCSSCNLARRGTLVGEVCFYLVEQWEKDPRNTNWLHKLFWCLTCCHNERRAQLRRGKLIPHSMGVWTMRERSHKAQACFIVLSWERCNERAHPPIWDKRAKGVFNTWFLVNVLLHVWCALMFFSCHSEEYRLFTRQSPFLHGHQKFALKQLQYL